MGEDMQRYICPECGAGGAGPKGSTYKCHRCACPLMLPANNRTILTAEEKRKCNCDLRTKLVGDGCEVCNPELALEHARESRIKNVLKAFDRMATNCEYKQEHDADCHHPYQDFNCVCCAPCNCPLLLEG